MWSTFSGISLHVFENIDDVAVAIFIIIVGNKVAELLYQFICTYLEFGKLGAESIKIFLQLFIIVSCIISSRKLTTFCPA